MCLLYKEGLFTESNASSSVSASSPGYVSGVSYFYANSSHPEWFLTDGSGSRIHNPGYSSYWEMDVGNSAYQNSWAQSVITEAKQYGWNGVFADDLACWAYNTSATSTKYATRAAWQAAVQSFISNVGTQLHAAGLKLISNSSACVGYPSVLHNFAAAEDGVMEEGWMRPSVDPSASLATASSGSWTNQLSELSDAETNHKYYVAELPSNTTDTQAIRYGLATQLLAAGGYSAFDISGSDMGSYSTAFWSPDYSTAQQLGAPAGGYYKLSNGVYRRDFANGTVLVNPTGSTQTANLGASYTGSGLTSATTATMAPETGLLLLVG
jgi:hypothetical protein